MRWWWTLLLLPLLPAAAAELTLAADPVVGRIQPDVEIRPIKVHAELDCATALSSTSPLDPGGLVVPLTFQAPAGVVVSGPPEIRLPVRDACPNAEGFVRASQDLAMSANHDVAGLVPHELRITGATDPTVPAAEPVEASISLAFEVGFFRLMRATMPTKILQLPPGASGTLEIELTNEGNADVVVGSIVLDGSSASWVEATAPAEPIPVPRGATVKVPLSFAADGKNANSQAAFQAVVAWHAAGDSSLPGTPLTTNMMVSVRHPNPVGSILAPGPGIAMLLPALAAAAALAFRRRP